MKKCGVGRSTRAAFALIAATICIHHRPGAAIDFDGSYYVRNASLHTDLDIFWTVDTELQTIRMAVHAKAASGWVGVGISEMGGMEGADIAFYEAETGIVTDAHTIVAGTPVVDECTQDWTLVSAEVDTDGLVFEAERALDTGDSQDRVFIDDSADGASPTRLIAAWGDTETVSYHSDNFAKGEIFVFGGVENSNTDPLLEITANPDVSFFDVTANNFPVPTDRTTYQQTCTPASDLPLLDEFHVIGFEGVVQNSTSKYVHHLVLIAFTDTDDCSETVSQACTDWTEANGARSSDTNDGYNTDGINSSSSTPSSYSYGTYEGMEYPSFCVPGRADIFVWTPGAADYALPEDVGFRFGNASGGYTSVAVQTHYNNPDGDAGIVDNSGVRVYYTEELRSMDMGVIVVGDPDVSLKDQPVSEGNSFWSFECPSSCTEDNFEDESVTVFSHFLHMHENGQRMQTRQYRTDSSGNEDLVRTADVEYYSFLQAGGFGVTVDENVTIQKGDRFETTCYYDTSLSSISADNVTFGEGSENEMCMDFIYYYPKQDLPNRGFCGVGFCGGSMLENLDLADDTDFGRSFGIVDTCTGLDEEVTDPSEVSSSSVTRPHALGLFACSAVVTLVLAGGTALLAGHLV